MKQAIRTENLTKRYGDKLAVNGLNLTIMEGELFALLGVNGAGKTTTIKMLSCLARPTAGDAFLLEQSIVTQAQAVKSVISISPQETAVARNLTVRENLEFMAGIHGMAGDAAKKAASEMIGLLGLEENAASKAKTLSGGTARRLSIAMR